MTSEIHRVGTELQLPVSPLETDESARRLRVLCVDDDPQIRIPLAEALADSGYDVRCAADGPSAIHLFQTEGADLVVLDLGLPGMDGLAVCRELKAHSGDTFLPVLFLTARADVDTMAHLLDQGGDDFCAKPFLLEELSARIKVLLRVRERERRLERRTRELRTAALADPLTGLGNRRAFEDTLSREWARAERRATPLALLVADVDWFKSVNDSFGHAAGDRVLKAVAGAITGSVREGDQAFRFGGEEFAILIPDATRLSALRVADRVRRRVASLPLETGRVTVSLGVGLGPGPGLSSVAELFQSVDQALYSAKAAGRDRVVAAWPPEPGRRFLTRPSPESSSVTSRP